jgi:hypothetical protein
VSLDLPPVLRAHEKTGLELFDPPMAIVYRAWASLYFIVAGAGV